MERKGITPIVAIVLLLMMTVSVAGLGYVFVIGIQSEAQSKTKENADTFIQQASLCFRIEAATDSSATLLNCGVGIIHNNSLTVTIDGVSVPYRVDSIPAGERKILAFGHQLGNRKLMIKIPSGISHTYEILGGSALQFDGIDDYVHIPNSPSLTPPNNITTEITIEAWIRPNNIPSLQAVAQKEGSYGLRISPSDTFHGLVYAPGHTTTNAPSEVLSGGMWSHVAFTVTSSSTAVYHNGKLVTSNVQSLGGINGNSEELIIGSDEGSGMFFNGSIDEVRIYARALSAAEIENNYYGTYTNDGLISHWSFDNIQGCNVQDSTGLNNGELQPNCPQIGTNHPTVIIQ